MVEGLYHQAGLTIDFWASEDTAFGNPNLTPGGPMLDTLHPSLRGAIQAGWEGLTLVEDDDEGSLVLVCATPAARATARQGPCLGVRRAPAPRDGGLIVLSMEAAGTGTLELGVDLSYAGGRTLALRLADDPALRVLLVGPDDGEPPVAARVCLREETRGMLRRAVATAGEWRITDPVPDDPAAGDSLPRLAPAPGDPGVALHVPIERLPGLTDGKGIEITLEDRHGLSPSLLVRPRGDARAEPLRLTLGCRPGPRAPAGCGSWVWSPATSASAPGARPRFASRRATRSGRPP
jgi:hypothetical protein